MMFGDISLVNGSLCVIIQSNSYLLICFEIGRWSGRDGHCAVIFNGNCIILGGTDDPYFCRNGQFNSPVRIIYVLDVWTSENGISWIKLVSSALWSPRWQHAAVVHDKSLYLLGGWGDEYLNDGNHSLCIFLMIISLEIKGWSALGDCLFCSTVERSNVSFCGQLPRKHYFNV